MGKPVAPKKDMAMAFPDVCLTPAPPGPPIPVPYPNLAQFANATGVSDVAGKELLVGGFHVLLQDSTVGSSDGDQAGSSGGVKSGGVAGECKIVQASGSVVYGPNKLGLARLMDQTRQNGTNANGFVLSADPTVLVGD